MTEKSDSRIARDKIRKAELARQRSTMAAANVGTDSDNCWDDLEDMYRKYLMVFAGYGYMGEAMNDREMLRYMADPVGFTERVRLLKHDLDMLRGELEAIYALHKGRTGGKNNPDDLMASLEIYEHYQVWMSKHDGICEPVSNEIRSMVANAEGRMLAAKKAKEDAAKAEAANDAPSETKEQ